MELGIYEGKYISFKVYKTWIDRALVSCTKLPDIRLILRFCRLSSYVRPSCAICFKPSPPTKIVERNELNTENEQKTIYFFFKVKQMQNAEKVAALGEK